MPALDLERNHPLALKRTRVAKGAPGRPPEGHAYLPLWERTKVGRKASIAWVIRALARREVASRGEDPVLRTIPRDPG